MHLKPGTRVEFHANPAFGVPAERGTVQRWIERINGPRNDPRMQNRHIVKYDTGGAMNVHESHFHVIKD